MRRFVLVTLLAMLLLGCTSTPTTTTPKTPNVKEVISKIRNKYNEIKSLEGYLTVYIGESPTKAKFWFKKPHRYRLETKQVTYIQNGNVGWQLIDGKATKFENVDVGFNPDYGELLKYLDTCKAEFNGSVIAFKCNESVLVLNDLASSFEMTFDAKTYLPKEITFHTAIGPIKYVYDIKKVNGEVSDNLFEPPENVNVTVAPVTSFKSWKDVMDYLGREIPYPEYTANEELKAIYLSSAPNMWMIKAIYDDFVVNIVSGEHHIKPQHNVITLRNGVKANYEEAGGYRGITFSIDNYNVLIKATSKIPKDELIKIANSIIH